VNYTKIAQWFVTTETCAALRFGEVTGEPLALISPRAVVVRGDEWVWPDERELRAIARRRVAPGIRKTRLRDDPRRLVLRAG
jgi:hypothetical protein